MKHNLLIAAMMLLCVWTASAQKNAKFQIAGPEKSYNMVRVENQTHYTDFSCMVYFLEENEGKYVVSSTLGSFTLGARGDMDSNKVRTYVGQWIGVKLPDEMADVTVSLSYKDLPLFDIVIITLSETAGTAIGTEF